jgi:5-methylcytosine-specific restriction endonuclease McrA
MERAGGMCEMAGCGRPATECHHRRLRSQGGGNGAENLMCLCEDHHRDVHENPAKAYAEGTMLHGYDDDPDARQSSLDRLEMNERNR